MKLRIVVGSVDPVGEKPESVVRRWPTGMLFARAIHASRRAKAGPKGSSTGSF